MRISTNDFTANNDDDDDVDVDVLRHPSLNFHPPQLKTQFSAALISLITATPTTDDDCCCQRR